MVKKLFFILATLGVATATQAGEGAKLSLSQKDIAELVLKQGLKAKEVDLKYQQLRFSTAQELTKYDWKLNVETGFEYDKSATFSTNDTKYERLRTLLGVNKSFITGTNLGLEFSRLSQKFDQGSLQFSQTPASATLDSVGLTLQQSILGNFLGATDRAQLAAVELNFQANSLLRADELQDAVLEGIRLFWNSYVAQENFRETMASRDRYKKLVDTVRRKSGYGYTSPGELTQVQAELEVREQAVKKASIDYLANLENLQLFLDLPRGTEIEFVIPQQIPPLPSLAQKDISQVRELRSQQLKVEAAQAAYDAAQNKSYPQVNLVGRIYATGADETVEGSLPKALSGSNPKYYAGVQLTYNFGSDFQTEDIINKKSVYELEKTRLYRQKLEVSDREAQAQRKVAASFAIAESAKKQKEFRDKTVTELQRSYNQGRTDIRNLIEALNSYFNAEVQLTRALGDYQIALNEWAAIRDELIPDTTKEN
ncbi:MAG: TolC family protein [Bdellovibrionia bacterium]